LGLNTDDYSYSDTQVAYIDYAWKISCDPNFLYLLKAENGQFTPDRVHPRQPGSIGTDMGFCGINSYYHPEIVKDPNFKDWKWQMDKCYSMYEGNVTFYGLIRLQTDKTYAKVIKSHFK